MLVVGGELVTAALREDGSTQLSEAHFGRLEFNWHSNDEPRTTVIEVVQEDHFLARLDEVSNKDDELEERIHKIRVQGVTTSGT
jgi:hypothetical protein